MCKAYDYKENQKNFDRERNVVDLSNRAALNNAPFFMKANTAEKLTMFFREKIQSNGLNLDKLLEDFMLKKFQDEDDDNCNVENFLSYDPRNTGPPANKLDATFQIFGRERAVDRSFWTER